MSAPGQELAQRTPVQALVAQVRDEKFKEQVALALPDKTTAPDRFIRATVTALMENPALANADQQSLLQSLIKSAQDGLLPDGREAALVLYKGKVSYLPMIGGFRKIAAEHGWTLRTQVVYANDAFEYTEEPPTLLHRPVRPGAERGDLIAAYAVANHKDGRRLQRVLHPGDIAERRAMAQTDRVWTQWRPQMWEKTAGRDLFAEIPLDEKDRERVDRVLRAAVTPADAVRLLYGHTPVAGELPPPATPERQAPADDPDPEGTTGGAGQQAGVSEASLPADETPAPATDDPYAEATVLGARLLELADQLGVKDATNERMVDYHAGHTPEELVVWLTEQIGVAEKSLAERAPQGSFFERQAAEAQAKKRAGKGKAA